jgi:AraC-like DNA-binding protein
LENQCRRFVFDASVLCESGHRRGREAIGIARNAHLEKMAMSEIQSFRTRLQTVKVSGLASAADIEIGMKESAKSRSEALEIYRVDPSAQVVRTFETINARLDLLRFAKHSSPELEFLTPSHLVVFLTDGISKGCEWSDGHQTRMLTPVAPYTVMFNPAQNYLRIRASVLKNHCHMLMLTIWPSVMSWRNDLEMDLAAVRFQQKIGLNDEAACQSLLAMQQELEAPGINGAFYVDILLFLLLTRLMRCASNLAEPSKATCAKGGLPSWRLKRAIELLEVNLAKMPTLAEVAELIGLHPTSFCRGFKRSMGLSPHHYMLVHRVNRAKEMMNDERLSLTEIALDCGFGSSSQFSIVFKRITGMSPRDFRRAL